MTSNAPGARDVPAGMEYALCALSASRSPSPDRSAVDVPVLMSSTQSAGEPAFDLTSLILMPDSGVTTTSAGLPMVPGEPISLASFAALAPVLPSALSSEIMPLNPSGLVKVANGAAAGDGP